MSKKGFFTLATVLLALVLVSSMMWMGCSDDSKNITSSTSLTSFENALGPNVSATEVARVVGIQNKHTSGLMKLDGVVGTATGLGADGRPVIKVYAERAGLSGIPSRLDGVAVEVQVTGKFVAHGLTKRYRPVPIGVSVGNNNECASGTIGCVVTKSGKSYILSNNHVLARENDAALGEPIVQPGRYDNRPKCANNLSTDQVAVLSEFEPIKFDGQANTYDAAIAEYITTDFVCATPSSYYGLPGTTPVDAYVGQAIQKVGRTTSLTTGTVTAINATVNIGYTHGTATFTGQIVTSSSFDKSGDSGSLVVTNDAAASPVALLFAGTNDGTAIVSPIAPVLSRFGVTICGQ
jgi:hypothetical protein